MSEQTNEVRPVFETADPIGTVSAPAKPVKAPKPKASKPKQVQAIHLGQVKKLDGSVNPTFKSAFEAQFSEIALYRKNGKGKDELVATIVGPKADAVGDMCQFILAALSSYTSGMGLAPDGALDFVEKSLNAVKGYASREFWGYTLRAVPKGRSGTSVVVGRVQDFVDLALMKAKVLKSSIVAGGTIKRQISHKPSVQEQKVTVQL